MKHYLRQLHAHLDISIAPNSCRMQHFQSMGALTPAAQALRMKSESMWVFSELRNFAPETVDMHRQARRA